MLEICPSLLNVNFLDLRKNLDILSDLGIKTLHLDIMDGHFVPEISFGPQLIELIKRNYNFVLDTHLMLSNPEDVLSRYVDAGSDFISVHVECSGHLDRMLAFLRSQGVQAGLAFNPATAINLEEGIWTIVDRVILMSVNPGFGGQKLIPYTLQKLSRLRNFFNSQGLKISICMDGGINLANILTVAKNGANDVVVGSYLFQGNSLRDRLELLKKELDILY